MENGVKFEIVSGMVIAKFRNWLRTCCMQGPEESPPSIETIEIVDHRDLLDLAIRAEMKFDRAVVWWRGHSSSDFHLVPSIYRVNGNPRHIEHERVFRFQESATTRYPNCPSPYDYCGWLMLMQHHGLETRLLDWTLSILSAAYFAVRDASLESEPKKPATIWALAPALLNESQIGKKGPVGADFGPAAEIIAHAFAPRDAECEKYSLALIVPENTERMRIQQGRFTVHGSSEPLENSQDADSFLLRVNIPPKSQFLIKKVLDRCGFTQASLFPDLDNLSQYLKAFNTI